MKFFLLIKPWQLLLLVAAVPLGLIAIFVWCFPTHSTIGAIYAASVAVGWLVGVVYVWVWSVGKILSAKIKQKVQKRKRLFYIAVGYNFIMLISVVAMSGLVWLGSAAIPPYLNALVFLWVVSSAYAWRYVKRVIAEAEGEAPTPWIGDGWRFSRLLGLQRRVNTIMQRGQQGEP